MYKKQLVFQKYACLFAVIAAAVSFVYSLGIITDIYDTLYSTMMNPADLTQTFVPGSIIYYDMQNFNRQFTNVSIVLILTACLLISAVCCIVAAVVSAKNNKTLADYMKTLENKAA